MKTISTFILLFFLAVSSYSQSYYIKFAGVPEVPGNSENANFNKSNGWSEISSLDMEVFTPINDITKLPQGLGEAQTGMVSFRKPFFAPFSNKVNLALHSAKSYDKITIVGTKLNGSGVQVPFVLYEFETAQIGNMQYTISNTLETLPEENYRFKSGTFKVYNFKYSNPDFTGTASCYGTGWNFKTNTEIITTGCPTI